MVTEIHPQSNPEGGAQDEVKLIEVARARLHVLDSAAQEAMVHSSSPRPLQEVVTSRQTSKHEPKVIRPTTSAAKQSESVKKQLEHTTPNTKLASVLSPETPSKRLRRAGELVVTDHMTTSQKAGHLVRRVMSQTEHSADDAPSTVTQTRAAEEARRRIQDIMQGRGSAGLRDAA